MGNSENRKIDKDLVSFVVVALIMLGIAGVVASARSENSMKKMQKEQVGKKANDTLVVLGYGIDDYNKMRAIDSKSDVREYRLAGADSVFPGDTIIVDSNRIVLLKNITQNNLRKIALQKQR